MSARESILKRLREVEVVGRAMPSLDSASIRFEDRVAHFVEVVHAVGGEVVEQSESL